MGLGVFFPDNSDDVANDIVLYYCVAQIYGALQALNDGWLDYVFLNPGNYGTIATTVIDWACRGGTCTDATPSSTTSSLRGIRIKSGSLPNVGIFEVALKNRLLITSK